MVNKFYKESRLIQTGCTVPAADAAGSLCWNRRKKDEAATEFQGDRAGAAHHMPAGPRQRKKKRERGCERNQTSGFIPIWGRPYYTTGSLNITYCKHMLQVSSIFASFAQIELLSI